MKQAVLLLAHGAPESLEDVEPYLLLVRGGRPLAPHIVREIRQRYAEIGGSSPLLSRTRGQARGLESRLAAETLPVKVYVGMRNWHPFIKETMAEIEAEGVDRIVAICMAPQYSKMSVGFYFRKTQEAKRELGMKAEIAWTKSFHAHPLLIEAFHQKLAPLLPQPRVLFTAHSLPERILASGDPYDTEAKATARAVAERAKLENWEFAYQSQGMTEEEWLGPTVESRIDQYSREGVRDFVLAPIGFVCDHVETLYDVDVHFTNYARERGIRLHRPESLNDSPTFVAALAAVVRERLQPV
jgi:ferrochelatase